MLPPELNQAMYGFIMSQVLFVGDELGVFDKLAANGPSTSTELAAGTTVGSDALERLLLAATGMGLLRREGAMYRLRSEMVPFLKKSSENYVGGSFGHYKDVAYPVFQHLRTGLEENRPQWDKVVGSQGSFHDLYKDPVRLERFLASMWWLGYRPAKELVAELSLDRFSTVVDLGGGSGSFSIAALEQCPSLEVILFDLPPVEQYLRKHHGPWFDRGLRFRGGDFFKDNLPDGEVYALGYILSDWTTEQSIDLLTKIYEALPDGGMVLILEKLFDEDMQGPLPTAMMHLDMLIETGGCHRSGSEYVALLNTVGFRDCEVVRSSGDKHMVIGHKTDEITETRYF